MRVILNVTHEDGTQEGVECDAISVDVRKHRIRHIDFSPLHHSTNLREISLQFTRLEDIDLSPLGTCKQLRKVQIGTGLREYTTNLKEIDLTPLSSNTNLEILTLRGHKMSSADLSPLSSCTNLQQLHLNHNRLRTIDLSPLSTCENLRELQLQMNQLRTIDLAPLRSNSRLQRLHLGWNQLKRIDIRPLSTCTNLVSLSIQDNKIGELDLAPLASCHAFHRFDIDGNPIQSIDVTPLVLNPSFDWLGSEDVPQTLWVPVRWPEVWHKYASLNSPAPYGSWEFLHRIASIPQAMSISVQSYVLTALGLEAYGMIDADISETLTSIAPESSIEKAKETVRSFVIGEMCQQIDRSGTTIGLDEVILADVPEFTQRLDQIALLRSSEMKEVVARKEDTEYNIFQFALTANGFNIIEELDLRSTRLFKGRMRITVRESDIARIQDAMQEMGHELTVKTVEDFNRRDPIPFEPKSMSRQMMYYVLGLVGKSRRTMNYALGLTDTL